MLQIFKDPRNRQFHVMYELAENPKIPEMLQIFRNPRNRKSLEMYEVV